jgi:ribonuclease Y
MLTAILLIITSVICLSVGYLIRRYIAERKIQDAEAKAKYILDKVDKEAQDRRREVELEAKDLMFRLRQDFENETKQRRQELAELEKRFTQKEINLDRRLELLERKEKEFEAKATTLSSYR